LPEGQTYVQAMIATLRKGEKRAMNALLIINACSVFDHFEVSGIIFGSRMVERRNL
jgi:hypothetical protein